MERWPSSASIKAIGDEGVVEDAVEMRPMTTVTPVMLIRRSRSE